MPTPRTPARLRGLQGLPQPVDKAPRARMIAADPPSWLPNAAKAEWRRVVQVLSREPLWLQETDRAVLTAYCVTWSVFLDVAKDLAKRGPLVPARSSADQARDRDVLVKNPACQVLRDATATLRSLCQQLGFTPDSRGRIDLPASSGHKGEDLLSGPSPERLLS